MNIFVEFVSNVKRLFRGERAAPVERCIVCGGPLPLEPWIDKEGRKYCNAEEWVFRPAILRKASQ